MKIGILGSGNMATALALGWAKHGHEIMIGSRTPTAIKARFSAQGIAVESHQQALEHGEIIVVATPWAVTEALLQSLNGWHDKIVIDITNALAPDLSELVVGGQNSAAESIARCLAEARVVKAFNGINAANISEPDFYGEAAQVFYCGDDEAAKAAVAVLIEQLGFEAIDTGELRNARYLEGLAMLWIQMAFVQGHVRHFGFKRVSA